MTRLPDDQKKYQQDLVLVIRSSGHLVIQFYLLLIRSYQLLISPWLGCNCRFEPSCSHYAKESLTRHGALKGSLLTLWRLLRCNPFASAGYDPVPTPKR